MNSVERVKSICKERKIPISKLESDLKFGNGYVGQLRKGVFPADRLAKIADYLSVTTDYLLTGETKKRPPMVSAISTTTISSSPCLAVTARSPTPCTMR